MAKHNRRSRTKKCIFFIGMTINYHLYTILFSGFNPFNYMMIWYAITLLSPLLAYVCWYAKGKGKLPFIISTILVLHTYTKRTIYSLIFSLILSFIIRIIV